MKPKLILCLALALSGGLFGCSMAPRDFEKTQPAIGFPILPPIADANPLVRKYISVQVPTKFKIARTIDTLTIGLDRNSFESTNLLIGKKMITGIQAKIFIYPAGERRPANGDYSLAGGLDFDFDPCTWNATNDKIPLPGKKYIVEQDFTIFETDIPTQHMWNPQGGKNYKILWQRTLKQTIE
jgi:hypothetical protein